MEFGIVAEGVTPPTFESRDNDALRTYAVSSSNIIFVYSSSDPWSTGKIELPPDSLNQRIIIDNASHTADISEMTDADKATVLATVATWLGAE